jgi:hypothetical protein
MILSRWAKRRAFGAAFGDLRAVCPHFLPGFCCESGERRLNFKIYFTGPIVPNY